MPSNMPVPMQQSTLDYRMPLPYKAILICFNALTCPSRVYFEVASCTSFQVWQPDPTTSHQSSSDGPNLSVEAKGAGKPTPTHMQQNCRNAAQRQPAAAKHKACLLEFGFRAGDHVNKPQWISAGAASKILFDGGKVVITEAA